MNWDLWMERALDLQQLAQQNIEDPWSGDEELLKEIMGNAA